MISYENLWNIMKEKGITQHALIKQYNISPGQITQLKRNESVSTHTIDMFCRILDCEASLEHKRHNFLSLCLFLNVSHFDRLSTAKRPEMEPFVDLSVDPQNQKTPKVRKAPTFVTKVGAF